MQGSRTTKKEAGSRDFAASFYSKDEGESDSPELSLDLPDAREKTEPAWIFRSRGARMEGMAVSLWAWLMVGILSACFSIWLIEVLSRLGTKLP